MLALFAVTMIMVEVDHIVRGERSSIPRKGDDHTTSCINGETPMTQCGALDATLWEKFTTKIFLNCP